MSTQTKSFLTPADYLAIERKAETKSEYLDGEMFLMSGSSREHNIIVANITRELSRQLKGKPCETYPSDMRVYAPATGLYTYPDVVVVCGGPAFQDAHVDTLLNPTLIVEVLSESTESYDRGKKFAHYRSVESLAEYLLVAQDEYRAEQFVRQHDGRWLLTDIRTLDSSVELSSVPCRLDLREVYERIELP